MMVLPPAAYGFGGRHFMDAGARLFCGFRKPDQQLQRMDMAGAGIACAAEIMAGADTSACVRPLHVGNMRIAVAIVHRIDAFAVIVFVSSLVRNIELPRQIPMSMP